MDTITRETMVEQLKKIINDSTVDYGKRTDAIALLAYEEAHRVDARFSHNERKRFGIESALSTISTPTTISCIDAYRSAEWGLSMTKKGYQYRITKVLENKDGK